MLSISLLKRFINTLFDFSKDKDMFNATTNAGKSMGKAVYTVIRTGVMFGGLFLFVGCGDKSDELVMEESPETTLKQCEILFYGEVGTPIDPVVVNGETVAACQLNLGFGQLQTHDNIATDNSSQRKTPTLKSSWNYKPLVWVLDSVYEVGQSMEYANLAELEADIQMFDFGDSTYAKENSVVIVHRNAALLAGVIHSLDDNTIGGGEWGGFVVNGFGHHQDCPENASADNFCNIQGPYGYFGGLGQGQRVPEGSLFHPASSGRSPIPMGFIGGIAEAGQPLAVHIEGYSGGVLSAALTAYAPYAITLPKGVYYSATDGIALHGGYWAGDGGYLNQYLLMKGNQGHSIIWDSGFVGTLSGVILHDSAAAAVSAGQGSVILKQLTLVDKNKTAGTALTLGEAASVTVTGSVIDGFSSCLAVAGPSVNATVNNTVFHCENTQAANDTYALNVINAATNLYTVDPMLSPLFHVESEAIVVPDNTIGISWGKTGLTFGDSMLTLEFPECMGVGTALAEKLSLKGGEFTVCQLDAQVNTSAILRSFFDTEGDFDHNQNLDYTAENVAWLIDGEVTIGADFSALTAEQQLQNLQAMQKLTVFGSSVVLAKNDTNARLVINPGVDLNILGSADTPVAIKAVSSGEGAITSAWGGLEINGWTADCPNTGVCAEAEKPRVKVGYLRLFDTGAGDQPALSLNQLGSGDQFSHLDIAGGAAAGVAISGGAVNLDNLLVSGVRGDQLSWRNGYTGTIQYGILQANDAHSGYALHGKNREDNHNGLPRSRPVLANITAIGGDASKSAILLEQGSGLILYNSVMADFPTCLDIDDEATALLQSNQPPGIYFESVVLDCDATLVEEDEDTGADYGYLTQQSGSVYEAPAVLDTNFIATGEQVPSGATLDNALLGPQAYEALANTAYAGAVFDVSDNWYSHWSDSVSVVLSPECDYLGTLEDPGDYPFYVEYNKALFPEGTFNSSARQLQKICSLRGTVTEDLILPGYTGADRAAYENGERVGGTYYTDDQDVMFYTEEKFFIPAPTVWLLNGMVHIGKGHMELTDTAQITELKANPVTLTIEANAIVMAATENSGLHITRGGALMVAGEPYFERVDEDDSPDNDNTSAPVNFIGLAEDFPNGVRVDQYRYEDDLDSLAKNRAVNEPLDEGCLPWKGLIVDGFGRHNQCPQADTAEPGSQVCNIAGEYGYYGGYDNDYDNLFASHLIVDNAPLHFNAVGRGAVLNLLMEGRYDEIGGSFLGSARISFDGGAVNMDTVTIGASYNRWGQMLKWNHGYQGTIQHFYARAFLRLGSAKYEAPLLNDGTALYPLISGFNIAEGDTNTDSNALPRSMPTLANITLYGREYDPYEQQSSYIELGYGSGLFLYNSVIGANNRYFDDNELLDYAAKLDDSVTDLLGSAVVFDQVAYSALSGFSTNGSPSSAFGNSDVITVLDWTISRASSETDYDDGAVPGLTVPFNHNRSYPAESIVYGADGIYTEADKHPIDYSTSTTVDSSFIVNTSYLGALDYFLVLDGGETIVD